MEWIDIKKQMPELGVTILVFGDDRRCIARMESFTTSSSGIRCAFLVGEFGYEDLWIAPTHWMPLPEPPKTNEE